MDGLTIIQDTRENLVYTFSRYPCQVQRGTLASGDYSILGYELQCAVERKSLPDLVGSLTSGRDRFERELDRLSLMSCSSVVVEATIDQIRRHEYTSKANPKAIINSVLALQQRARVPFIWCGSRSMAQYCTYTILRRFVEDQGKQAK